MDDFPADQVGAIQRDPAALDRFYRMFIEDVSRFVARRVGDPHLAADLTADIFLAAIDGAHGYRANRGTPRAWLFGIARTQVRSSWRGLGRRIRATQRLQGRALIDQHDLERLEHRIDAQREARLAYEELTAMPMLHRRLFELVAVDGWPVVEAAAAVGMSPETARVRIHRIRRRLRAALEPDTGSALTEGAPS